MVIKEKKQKLLILAIVSIFIVVGLYLLLHYDEIKNNTTTKYDSGKISERITSLASKKKSLKIVTNPSEAEIFVREISKSYTSPVKLNYLDSNKVTIQIIKDGYFVETKEIILEENKNSITEAYIKLKKIPETVYNFKYSIPSETRAFRFPGREDIFYMYQNYLQGSFEFYDGYQVLALWPDKINQVHKIDWLDNKSVVLTNGYNENKKSYLIDLSSWDMQNEPKLTEIPVHGNKFYSSPFSNEIAYFGEINYDDAISKLYKYNTLTKESIKISDEEFFGVHELIWLDENTFITAEVHNPIDHYTSNVFLVKVGETGSLEKTKIISLISPPRLELSPSKDKLVYQKGISLYTYDLNTGQESQIYTISNSYPEIEFISDNKLLLAYSYGFKKVLLEEIEIGTPNTRKFSIPLEDNNDKTSRFVTSLSIDLPGYATISMTDGTSVLLKYDPDENN